MLKSARQSAHSAQTPVRSLLVVSDLGVPDCLLFAIEHEFDAVEVIACPDVASACRPFDHPVALLLADSAALRNAGEVVPNFTRLHPLATIAAMVDDERDAARFYAGSPVASELRGILPMNLKLDLWLSIVALMLRGGEYFPAAMLRDGERMKEEHSDIRWALSGAHVRSSALPRPRAGEGADLGILTGRELEVLRHVARGTQNKLIAVELGLSENTVKIHIHNVIRKLGTRNRTEAAAVFLHGMGVVPKNASTVAAVTSEMHGLA